MLVDPERVELVLEVLLALAQLLELLPVAVLLLGGGLELEVLQLRILDVP